MSLIRRLLPVTLVFGMLTVAPMAAQAPGETPGEQTPAERTLEERAQDPFVPISELPPEEQLPAAPMLVGAYVFVILALFGYLISLSRRLGSVSQEITRLEGEVQRASRR